MSGHSKWSKIKHQKAVSDVKKGSLFTKLGRTVTIAAKEGGDPNFNFKLRLAIEQAKIGGVPKDTIERAIKKGTGEDKEGAALEEILYEGFGPGGVAILVSTVTGNKNRTVSNVKHILSQHGGSLGGAGSVAWMFLRKGALRFDEKALSGKKSDDFQLELIEAGVEDIKEEDGEIAAYLAPEKLEKVKKVLEEKGIAVSSAEIEFVAKDQIQIIDPHVKANLERMFEELDENEDVSDFYTNVA